MGETVDSETAFSEYTESEWDLLELTNYGSDEPHEPASEAPGAPHGPPSGATPSRLRGFIRLDAKYFVPFFTRRFTSREVAEGRRQMSNLTDKWFREVRSAPSGSEDEQAASDGAAQPGEPRRASMCQNGRETEPLLPDATLHADSPT